MAKFNFCQRLFTIQLICTTIIIFHVHVEGIFDGFKNKCSSVARSLVKVPSKIADGGQYVTHKVAGTVSNIVSPVAPLMHIVDAAGGTISNVMGSTSRLLGKTVEPPQDVLFLYCRDLKQLGTSQSYQEMVRMVIGQALFNVVLHKDEMDEAANTQVNLNDLPVLQSVINELEDVGANKDDIAHIISVLGRNGKEDLPLELKPKVLNILKDHENGYFKSNGPMNELRWISENPHGFYKMDDQDRTDYKLKTKNKYKNCAVIHIPLNDKNNL